MAQPQMAQPPAPAQPPRQKSFLRDTLEIVFLALVLYVVIQYAVQTVHVLGSSMYSTLHDNDLLVASKSPTNFIHRNVATSSYSSHQMRRAGTSSNALSRCLASGSGSRRAWCTSTARCCTSHIYRKHGRITTTGRPPARIS